MKNITFSDEGLTKRLWNGRFIPEDPAFGGLHPRGVAEAYLFELKDKVNIEQSLRNLQDSVTTVKVHKVVDDTYRLR